MRIAKCKHLACIRYSISYIGKFPYRGRLNIFDENVLTSERVNLWMSSEGMLQSLVIIQQANCLQISIFQNFENIYIMQPTEFSSMVKTSQSITTFESLKYIGAKKNSI